MSRIWRILYVLAVTAAFVAGFSVIGLGLLEGQGPTSIRTGRIIDSFVGESEYCSQISPQRPSTRRCRTVDNFTVIGEFEGGGEWSKKGEDPFDAVAREGGPIEVTTSDVTGRVVRLESAGGDWAETTTMHVVVGVVIVMAVVLVVGKIERNRRSEKWDIGSISPPEWIAVIPGLALGVAPLALLGVTLGSTSPSDDDSATSGPTDQPGIFIDDPFDYALVQEAADEGPGFEVNAPFAVSANAEMTTVGAEHLAADDLAAWQAADVFAVPLWQQGIPSGRFSIVSFAAGESGALTENIACPSGLRAFPEEIAPGPTYGGFVCFEAAAEGQEFHVFIGSRQIINDDFTPPYELSDGSTVEN